MLVCHHGSRSQNAAQWLAQNGYANAHNLRGGILVSAAALLWSTGGLVVRSLELADAWTTVLWRGFAAAAFLLAFIGLRERRNTLRGFLKIGWPELSTRAESRPETGSSAAFGGASSVRAT